jgi:hypothetical protein
MPALSTCTGHPAGERHKFRAVLLDVEQSGVAPLHVVHACGSPRRVALMYAYSWDDPSANTPKFGQVGQQPGDQG